MTSSSFHVLVDRRRRLLHLTIIGIKITDAVGKVSQEFKCGQRAVWNDWKVRDQWIPVLLKIGPEERDRVVWDALASLAEAKQEAYNTYLAVEGMARVAAIRVYLDAVKAEVEMRQSLGLLPTEPLRIQHRIVMLQGRFVEIGPDGKPVTEGAAK
jgi:hypothetical protein